MWIQSLRTYYASEKEMNTLRLCMTLGTVPVSCAAAANRFRRGGSIRVSESRISNLPVEGRKDRKGSEERMESQERERRSELTTEKGGFGWEQEKEVRRGREHDRIEGRPSEREREREREQVWERQGQREWVRDRKRGEYSSRETEFSYLGTPHPHPDICSVHISSYKRDDRISSRLSGISAVSTNLTPTTLLVLHGLPEAFVRASCPANFLESVTSSLVAKTLMISWRHSVRNRIVLFLASFRSSKVKLEVLI